MESEEEMSCTKKQKTYSKRKNTFIVNNIKHYSTVLGESQRPKLQYKNYVYT